MSDTLKSFMEDNPDAELPNATVPSSKCTDRARYDDWILVQPRKHHPRVIAEDDEFWTEEWGLGCFRLKVQIDKDFRGHLCYDVTIVYLTDKPQNIDYIPREIEIYAGHEVNTSIEYAKRFVEWYIRSMRA